MSIRRFVVLGALGLGCSADPYAGSPEPSTPAAAEASRDAAAPSGKPNVPPAAVPSAHHDGKPLATILPTAPLPLAEMLGQAPAKVEAQLGPPLPNQKGGMRDSCVRYIPERTWFHCKFAWQRYSDRTGTFAVVHVTYEDGKASGLSFEKIPGAGAFDPEQALRRVGLELPGQATVERPAADVTVWRWFNSEARLLVHGRQYRVQVSSIGGTWDSAKVDIILNDALNDSEKARAFEPKPRREHDRAEDSKAG